MTKTASVELKSVSPCPERGSGGGATPFAPDRCGPASHAAGVTARSNTCTSLSSRPRAGGGDLTT